MTLARLRWLPTLLLSLILLDLGRAPARAAAPNGCVDGGRPRLDDDGIGGTGAAPGTPVDDDGIGGTGARPAVPVDDDGIGGTGIALGGDTGVIGTVTGFASICVGDVEIHYDPKTPVLMDGAPASARELAVGQVVEVLADGSGSQLTARTIGVRHVVSGPVTSVDLEQNQISVAGQRVQLAGALGAEETPASSFTLASVVRVSGMRRADGVIEASRVAPAAETAGAVLVTGPLRELDSGALAIGGAEVLVDGPLAVDPGEEVRVVGHWAGDSIRAEAIEALPRVPFDGRAARVDIEGFARATSAGQMQIGAYAVEVSSAETGQPIADGARVRVEGQVQAQRVVVERVIVMNEFPSRPEKPDHGGRERNDSGFDEHRPGKGGAGAPPPEGRGSGREDKPPHARHGYPPPHSDRPAPPMPIERPDFPDKGERPQPPDRPELPHGPERPELPGGPERPDRPGRPDRPEIPHHERPEKPERPPRFEMLRPDVSRPERPPRFDRPSR